jgi:predicted transcriptional regulator
MGRRGWSDKEILLVEDLLSKGYSYREIASVLGRSQESVRGMVKRMRKGLKKEGKSDSRGGKRHRGLLDLSFEEVLALLGDKNKRNLEGGYMELVKKSLKEEGSKVRRNGYTLSDYEVTKIVERYLKRTGNIEGARNLWKLHLEYKRRSGGDDYANF